MIYFTEPTSGCIDVELPSGERIWIPTSDKIEQLKLEAQATYTAMMTDTLILEGEEAEEDEGEDQNLV